MDRSLRQSTRQGRAPKARTSNACEACKRRKTKCSGGPSPCDVCKRAETFCNFNPKLDTRRKLAYNSTTIQDRQQFLLTALFQTIQHSREDELDHLVSLIRGPSRPGAVATCLQKQFSVLQNKGIIPMYDIDDTDVISFGLQGLCGHRKGRARPKTPSIYDDGATQGDSPATMSAESTNSDYNIDDNHFQSGNDEDRLSSPFSIGTDQKFDPVGSFDPAGMLDAMTPDASPLDFYSSNSGDSFQGTMPQPEHLPNSALYSISDSSQGTMRSRTSDLSRSRSRPPSDVTRKSSVTNGSRGFSTQSSTAPAHIAARPYPIMAPEPDQYMMQYYQAMANSFPTTVNPSLDLKYGQPSAFPTNGAYGIPQEDFGLTQFAFSLNFVRRMKV